MRNIFLILFLLVAGIFANKSSAQAVILKADTVEVPCISTDTFFMPVRLDNFTNISGLQFTLQWDTARLDYVSITMLHPQFFGVGFDTSAATIALGKLTFAWTDLAGLSLPSDAVLFKVGFTRIGGPQTPVSFVSDPTAVAVFDNQFNELLAQTQPGAVKPLDPNGPSITCPANVITGASGPIPIPNIAPVLADDCGTPAAGWSSVGATVENFPNDPDASGALFNLGNSVVTYTTTDAGSNTASCSFNVLVEFSITTTDLTLIANPNSIASCGGTVSIDVLAFNFDSIAGLQFSMGWLPAALQYVSITNLNTDLNLALANFSTAQSAAGLLSFAWTSASLSGSTIPGGDVLFTLNFNVSGAGNVDFGDNPTAALAFTGTIFPPEEVPLILVDATVVVTDTVPPTITCPANVTVQAPGTTAVQGIAPASLNDNCAAPLVGWSVSGSTIGNFPNDPDASGDLFNIGTSTVTYTATDAGNNTASCSFNVTVEFANTSTELTIVANSANAACGGNFSIDVTALNFETVAGVQFTINWDASLFQFASISNFNLPIGIGAANFGVANVGNGSITFAWTSGDLNGSTTNNGAVLFRLNFTLLGNTTSGITFSDDPTVRLAFDGGTFDEIPMMTVDGQVSVADNIPPTLACPANVSVDAPQGQLFAPVNGLEPTSLTDNCGGVPGLSYTQTGATTNSGTGNANGNYNAGTTTVVYTATDANGNTATCSFQVVVDAGTPLILQVDSVDLGCQVGAQVTACVSVENFNDVKFAHFWLNWDTSVLDFVAVSYQYPGLNLNNTMFFNYADVDAGLLKFFGGSASWPDIPTDSAFYCITFDVVPTGTFPTSITFSGPIEAVNSGFQNVPVVTFDGTLAATIDNQPPVVTCPSDTIVNAPPLECNANYTPLAPTATDDCGTIASITYAPDTTIFYVGPPTTVTYTVTDEAGNISTCAFNVTVFSNIAPQLLDCPDDFTVNMDANCQAVANWTLPVFQDACMDVFTVDNHNFFPGSFFPLGPTTVVYDATDLSGNVTTCSFVVTVADATPPTITCPPNQSVTPIDGCSAIATFAAPVTTDNCDMDLVVICSDTSGTNFPAGPNSVTCTVIDDAGNGSQCAFVITVADAIAPSFPNGCPPNISSVSASGNCGANPTWQAPSASDNCDQNLSIISVPESGDFFPVQGSPHTVTYTVTDDLGNTGTCTFTVTVTDGTPPSLTNCPTLPIIEVLPVSECTKDISWTIPTAADNCGAVGLTLSSNLQPGIFPTGDTVVVYTATDASGNTATCSFLVSVKDVVPPVLSGCPTQALVIPNGNPCGTIVNFPLPTGTDNCTPEDELIYDAPFMPGDTFPIGTTTFPFTVTDASGNTDLCDITVTVMGQVPAFINVPANISVTGCDTAVPWTEPTAVGFCPPVTIVVTPLPSGSIFPFGTTTVTYMATDTFGNSATASFNVVVTETVPPVFDCPPGPIVVSVGGTIVSDPSEFLLSIDTAAGCNGVDLTFNLPTATDNCVTPTVTLLQGLPSGSVFTLGFNNLVFRAVDSSGNQAQCAVNVEVVALPSLAPVVDPNPGCAGDDLTITAVNIPGATYTWTGPVSSTTNVVQVNNLSAQNDGQYTVIARINGCATGPDTATVYMTVTPVAENDVYTINPGETLSFPSVLLNDNLSPAFDFEICETSVLEGMVMNTGDGTFSYTAGEEPGMVSFFYAVCSKTCNLEDQAVVTITINDTKCVFIPNIITPNGDDTNDWFTIPCIETGQFRENSLVVYNQWGDKVYEASPYSNDPAEAWRGTLDGEPGKDLPDGVYYYIFQPSPNAVPMKGFVEIFR